MINKKTKFCTFSYCLLCTELILSLYVASPDGKDISERLGKLVKSITIAGKIKLGSRIINMLNMHLVTIL